MAEQNKTILEFKLRQQKNKLKYTIKTIKQEKEI